MHGAEAELDALQHGFEEHAAAEPQRWVEQRTEQQAEAEHGVEQQAEAETKALQHGFEEHAAAEPQRWVEQPTEQQAEAETELDALQRGAEQQAVAKAKALQHGFEHQAEAVALAFHLSLHRPLPLQER
jgi:hypothetical protein